MAFSLHSCVHSPIKCTVEMHCEEITMRWMMSCDACRMKYTGMTYMTKAGKFFTLLCLRPSLLSFGNCAVQWTEDAN